MNEFQAKKLGEILAFETLSAQFFEKTKGTLKEKFSEESLNEIIEKNTLRTAKIKEISEINNASEITIPKSEKTIQKLIQMQDKYIGDEWDNPAELLEWLGFFEGAAIVHLKLVEGMAEKIENEELKTLTKEAVESHHDFFHKIGEVMKTSF